jgi:uncharacterized protein YlzI (FlbEa/FlbD family)
MNNYIKITVAEFQSYIPQSQNIGSFGTFYGGSTYPQQLIEREKLININNINSLEKNGDTTIIEMSGGKHYTIKEKFEDFINRLQKETHDKEFNNKMEKLLNE